MSESEFSPEKEVTVPLPVPAAPTIDKEEVAGRGELKVTVLLPLNAADGMALAVPLTKAFLFFKETSFAGSNPEAERQAGTANVALDIAPGANAVEFEVSNLAVGKRYFFAACVDL